MYLVFTIYFGTEEDCRNHFLRNKETMSDWFANVVTRSIFGLKASGLMNVKNAAVKCDERYALEGMIEFNEGYFTVESSEIVQERALRGRGAAGKQNVAVMAEPTPLKNVETGKISKSCRYFKAKILENHLSLEINETTTESIDNQSIVFTDKSTSCVDISDFVELHIIEKTNYA